jgi:ferrochelatase
VRGGREPDAELVAEFARRYDIIGGSPLIDITRGQAAALERELGWPVEIGMRFSPPTIEDGMRDLADRGVEDVSAIVLSPQYSVHLMGGYVAAVEDARRAIGSPAPAVRVAGAWFDQPAFVAAIAGRIRAALERLSAEGPRPHVLLTAHSLPRRVADNDPGYLEQLRSTAEAVADGAGLTAEDWTFCWQSAGHEPGEWMKPDFADLMPEIGRSASPVVVVAPVQFLADHLEILYDIDVGARDQAALHGVQFERIESLNADPMLISALAAVARGSA